MLAGLLVSTTSWRLFQVAKPVSDRIALSRHVAIVLAGSRQIRCVFVVIARWTLENDQTHEPVRHFFDAVFTYFLLGHCVVCTSSITSISPDFIIVSFVIVCVDIKYGTKFDWRYYQDWKFN